MCEPRPTTKRQLLVPNRVVFLPSQLWNWLNFCVWAWARTSVQILNGAQKDQVILHNVMTFTVNQTRVYTKNHAWNTGYQAVLTNFLSKLFFVHLLYLGLDHLIKTKNWAITTSNLSKQNQIFIKYFIYSISTNIVKEYFFNYSTNDISPDTINLQWAWQFIQQHILITTIVVMLSIQLLNTDQIILFTQKEISCHLQSASSSFLHLFPRY